MLTYILIAISAVLALSAIALLVAGLLLAGEFLDRRWWFDRATGDDNPLGRWARRAVEALARRATQLRGSAPELASIIARAQSIVPARRPLARTVVAPPLPRAGRRRTATPSAEIAEP